jgi:hypothetical protein
MKQPTKPSRQTVAGITSTLILGVSMSACSMDNTTTWKEEVLLHDGRKIIVERSTTRDPFGRREIGQSAPISEQTLSFTAPGTAQRITWKSDFGRTTQDNLELLALDIVGGRPYIVTYPSFCHAYDKWGRPNPSYVYFKLVDKTWERVAIGEFPKQISRANVIIGGYGDKEVKLRGMGIDVKQTQPFIPAAIVDQFNREGLDSSLLVFAREPIQGKWRDCLDPARSGPKAPDSIPPASEADRQK